MRRRVHIIVSGTVQGVFYRSETKEKATELGLVGWVRNASKGNVEIIAEGPEENLKQLIQWCRHGPPNAEVDDIDIEWFGPVNDFSSFKIRC
ncbi:acylphosphatase [Candidatus Woesearchaeota archaeon]|nr:acylphosphatase [Candidatus Woesearchaeota archaeon]